MSDLLNRPKPSPTKIGTIEDFIKTEKRYELKLWHIMLAAFVISAAASYFGYKAGERDTYRQAYLAGYNIGYKEGWQDKAIDVQKQCDSRHLPMRVNGKGYWCREVK